MKEVVVVFSWTAVWLLPRAFIVVHLILSKVVEVVCLLGFCLVPHHLQLFPCQAPSQQPPATRRKPKNSLVPQAVGFVSQHCLYVRIIVARSSIVTGTSDHHIPVTRFVKSFIIRRVCVSQLFFFSSLPVLYIYICVVFALLVGRWLKTNPPKRNANFIGWPGIHGKSGVTVRVLKQRYYESAASAVRSTRV